ncbi:MAG: ABC transporter permease [Chloroflexi bacterium]|nr:ABC transporter permease [Chloroflexota bacterium]
MIDTLVRAFRGTVRSPARTLLVVLLLAAGLSFALTSLALSFAADDELQKIKQTTGVQAGVSLSPDQFAEAIQLEFQRSAASGEPFDSTRVGQHITPLNSKQAEQIADLPYVKQVQAFTIAAVEYDLLNRKAGRENDLVLGTLNIALPDAVVTGTQDAAFLADFQTGVKQLKDGRLFTTEDKGKNVIVIDQETAAFENIAVGDKLVLKGLIIPPEGEAPPPKPQYRKATAEIIGTYADLETASLGGFSPARIEAWYAPIDTVRKLQQPANRDSLSAIAITYDNVDNVNRLRGDILNMLDSDLFVLTTTEDRFQDIANPVDRMRNTSFIGTVAGLTVVGLIMMMLMALVVRGRLREIGILKAVGARNRHVILQFALETTGLAVVAVLVAVPISLGSNSLIADAFRGSTEVNERQQSNNQQGPNLGAGARALTDAPVIDDPVRTEEVEAALKDVNASVSSDLIALAAVIAVGLGLLGALVPIVAVLRLRPAEVLRLEG